MSSIKKNYLYNVLYQALLVLAPIITIPYLSRVLGASGIGTVSFAESIVSYFVLFANLGINTYGQREISYAQDDAKRRSTVFYNVFISKTLITLIILIIYIIFYFAIINSLIYLIFSVQILSVIFDITWFFQGMEEFKKIVIRNAVVKLLSVLYIFNFVKSSNGILVYCIGVVIFPLIGYLSFWPGVFSYLDKVNLKLISFQSVIQESFTLFLPTIAIQIYTVFDKTMIGLITKDTLENGYYEQSIRISRTLLLIITALSTVVIPRIGYFFDKNDHKYVKEILYKSYRFVLMLSIPMCLGLLFVANNFVPWFLGNGFDKSVILVKIMSFLIIFIGLSNITGMLYFMPTKQQYKLTISVCIGAAINFILNCILIPSYKSIGAAVASVVAEAIITIVQFVLAKDYISFSRILKESYKYIVSGLIMFIILSIFMKGVTPSIQNTLLIAFTGVFCYFVILLLLKDEFLLNNINIKGTSKK